VAGLQGAGQFTGGTQPSIRVRVGEGAGQFGVNPAPLDLGQVVGDVAALVKP
jgi:hypothetical protein